MSGEVSTTSKQNNSGSFLGSIEKILHRARQQTVIRVLNEGLATEIICALRYRLHYYLAKGVHSQGVAQELLEHADEEQDHADEIAERIIQLGGKPTFSPERLLDSNDSEYTEGGTLTDMIRRDLAAEKSAVKFYSEIIEYLGDNDPTSRRMFEDIRAKKEMPRI